MSLDDLLKYQELRVEYFDLKSVLENNPSRERLKLWKKDVEKLQEKRKRIKEAADEKQKLLKRLSDSNEDLLFKEKELEEQLYSGLIKNPKELLSRQKQLLEIDEKRKQLDAKLTDEEMQLQDLGEQQAQLAKSITDQVKPYQEELNRYKQQREVDKTNLNALVSQIKDLEVKISPKLLAMYKKNAKRLGGDMVLAPLDGERCGGCHVDLSKVCISELKFGQDLVNCENCGRILYIGS